MFAEAEANPRCPPPRLAVFLQFKSRKADHSRVARREGRRLPQIGRRVHFPRDTTYASRLRPHASRSWPFYGICCMRRRLAHLACLAIIAMLAAGGASAQDAV